MMQRLARTVLVLSVSCYMFLFFSQEHDSDHLSLGLGYLNVKKEHSFYENLTSGQAQEHSFSQNSTSGQPQEHYFSQNSTSGRTQKHSLSHNSTSGQAQEQYPQDLQWGRGYLHVRKETPLPKNSTFVRELTGMLRIKMNEALSTPDLTSLEFKPCSKTSVANYNDTCVSTSGQCLYGDIPDDGSERIERLLYGTNNRVPDKYLSVIEDMRSNVKDYYDVIIVHALSSNHFNESQKFLLTMHRDVFPYLRHFKLLVYDLGLIPSERTLYEKHCRCTVITFPFEKLPEYFRTLKCFAWKILAIAAHFGQADVVIWSDASIRLHGEHKHTGNTLYAVLFL